jgi:type IV pilus biogenesis protein CpaD/CtpE
VRRAVIIGLALALAGCAPLDSRTPSSTRTVASAVARAERSHEYPSAGHPVQANARRPARDASGAVRAFATAYINWTATTVTAQLRALAALSVGQARAAMALAASETARDYELHRGGVANIGTVEAVAPVTGSQNQYAVVTRELTTATADNAYRGLRPAWHVTVATVVRVGKRGWAISGWQPEN